MQFIVQFYPAIATMLSMYFYKRDSPCMQSFYRRMTFSQSARKLFVLLTMLAMLIFNFCYLQSFGFSVALGASTLLCLSMFSFRITERGFFWLQGRLGIALVFTAMLTCAIKHPIWPLSMNLYLFTIGSVFYPSEDLMRQLRSPVSFSKFSANPATVLSGYYSR